MSENTNLSRPPSRIKRIITCAVVLIVVTLVLGGGIYATYVAMLPKVDESQATDTEIKKSKQDEGKRSTSITQVLVDKPIDQAENPMDPIIEVARRGLQHIDDEIRDYTATIVKQERVNGKLLEKEYIQCKIRNEHGEVPFSVYLKFIKPQRLANTESIYVKGQNDGKIIGHDGGMLKHLTLHLDPTGIIPMRNNRYPITEIGIRTLVARMVERAEQNRDVKDVKVKVERDIQVNGHAATLIQLIHPTKKPGLDFHIAKVYIDDEMNLPVGYEAFLFPETEGGDPPLLESYFYNDLKVNVGLTDKDFDPGNSEYDYKQ